MPLYPYDTRTQEAKIMRALVAAGDTGLPAWKIMRLMGPNWKTERALKRLLAFEKARFERAKCKLPHRGPVTWFALVADDTMVHGLDPEWSIVVDGT